MHTKRFHFDQWSRQVRPMLHSKRVQKHKLWWKTAIMTVSCVCGWWWFRTFQTMLFFDTPLLALCVNIRSNLVPYTNNEPTSANPTLTKVMKKNLLILLNTTWNHQSTNQTTIHHTHAMSDRTTVQYCQWLQREKTPRRASPRWWNAWMWLVSWTAESSKLQSSTQSQHHKNPSHSPCQHHRSYNHNICRWPPSLQSITHQKHSRCNNNTRGKHHRPHHTHCQVVIAYLM